MTIGIRIATIEDAAELAQLNKEVHSIHVENVPDVFRLPSEPEMIETFRMFIGHPDNKGFVALKDGVIVGYAILMKRHIPQNPFCKMREYVELDQICVKSQLRKMGIARQLVERAVEYAKHIGYKDLQLTVWGFNQNAQKSFASLGFEDYQKKMILRL